MAEYKVGGRVICVKDYPDGRFGMYCINKNETRTVRSTRIGKKTRKLVLHFEEAILPIAFGTTEYGYLAEYFLPLDDFKEVTFEKIKESVPVSEQ